MTLLDSRDIAPEERAAVADEPRPGVWVQEEIVKDVLVNRYGDRLETEIGRRQIGDGRALDQHQTDQAIVFELMSLAGDDLELIKEVAGGLRPFALNDRTVTEQRGGIHSDPLVRLLAFRAWGDRDRAWFEPHAVICRTFGFDEIDVRREHGHFYVDVTVRDGLLSYSFEEPDADANQNRRILFDVFERACFEAGLPLAGQRPIKSGYDDALVSLLG